MAAQINQITENETLYSHVYRENTQENIFADNQDFQTFIKFLKEYFSDTTGIENAKKTFTIRGRTYQGVPHQPQNFFNQLQLVAYKLEPNRFDLLIKQIVPGTLEKFIRAISTRYAIYFNKKYQRKGALFKDPYQSEQIKDPSLLSRLIQNLHSNFSKKDGVADHFYSSSPEYQGQRASEWIKPQTTISNEGLDPYKSPVEKGQPSLPQPQPRIPEIILAFTILLAFSSYGVINIETSKTQSNYLLSPLPTSSPQVSGVKTTRPIETTPTPTPISTRQTFSNLINQPLDSTPSAETSTSSESPETPKTLVVITITDGSESVNLRQEPTIESKITGTAKDDEEFELISELPGWYEIKLDDSQNAFVSTRYAEIIKEDDI